MKQDIKDFFRDEEVFKNELPANHRQEFQEKLNCSSLNTKVINNSYVYSIAASILVFFGIGYLVFIKNVKDEEVKQNVLVEQLETVKQGYLVRINKEWNKFIALTKDEKLISRYQNRLNDLDKDYQEISQQYIEDSNDILVLEALIENLQIRLQLLKNIQKHIKLLNQQNKQYENTKI